jgi:hypothetical protein
LPNLSIGVNLPVYPELVPVPGYPVYYAPQMDSNYFFYDGMYWVYESDNWYASSWYNGPWGEVSRDGVPEFVLRIPVRYYRQAPAAFRGWRRDAPPRWGERWGDDWAQRHNGWDHWNRGATPVRPPLPVYQRQYSGDRYPHVENQKALENKNYRYQARDPLVRQQRDTQHAPAPSAPVQPKQRDEPQVRNPADKQSPHPDSPAAPKQPVPQRDAAPPQAPPHPPEQAPRVQREPRPDNQERAQQQARPKPVPALEKPPESHQAPAQERAPAQPQRQPEARQPDRGAQQDKPQNRSQDRQQEKPQERQREQGSGRGRERSDERPDERGQDGRK